MSNSLYYYTQKERQIFLDNIIYLVDNKECDNSHILQYFESQGLKYKNRAIEGGEYSVLVPKNEDLGILMNAYLQRRIFIKRRKNLEELAQDVGTDRVKFESDMERDGNAEKHLIIESGNWLDVANGNYQSQIHKNAFFHSLLTFQTRHCLHIHFIDKSASGVLIRGIIENKVKELFNL